MDRAFGISDERSWNAFRAWRRLDRGHHIVWIGDSVSFGGRTPASKTFCALLEKKLRERFPSDDIAVDNFSVAGANAPEKLALLRQLDLPSGALVILQIRPDEWAHGTDGPLAETSWLEKCASVSGESSVRGRDGPPGRPLRSGAPGGRALPLNEQTQSGWMKWRGENEEQLSRVAERWIPMIRYRERMNMFLFGGTDAGGTLVSRDRFRQASWMPDVWAEWLTRKSRSETWRPELWDKARFERFRREHPFRIETGSTDHICLERLLADVKARGGAQSLVYLCPVNPLLLKTAMKESEYKTVVAQEVAWTKQRTSDFENLFGALDSSLFYDNLHLTDEGHRRMADVMMPLMERKIRELGWVDKEGKQ